MSRKKDKDFGKTKVLDINAHEKFLEEKLRQYKKKLDVEAKTETVSTSKSASEANTARLLGKGSGSKGLSNSFSNDGSFLDQFRKMTGQNNAAGIKKETSSGSKALLQSKVKEDSKPTSKLDSLKYHKLPSRAIMLPSFKGAGSSNESNSTIKKEVQDMKEELKEHKDESDNSGFGTFNKNQVEKDAKIPDKVPSIVPSVTPQDIRKTKRDETFMDTVTTASLNLTSSHPKTLPEQTTVSDMLQGPESLPNSSQAYNFLPMAVAPSQYTYEHVVSANTSLQNSTAAMQTLQQLPQQPLQQPLQQMPQQPAPLALQQIHQQSSLQPLQQLGQHPPPQPLQQMLQQPPLQQLQQMPPQPPPQPMQQLPQQFPQLIQQQLIQQPPPQQLVQPQLLQPPPPQPPPQQSTQQIVFVSQPAPQSALYMTSPTILSEPPPAIPQTTGLILQTQVSPGPQSFSTSYPLPQQTAYSIQQTIGSAQPTLYSTAISPSPISASPYSGPPPQTSTNMYGSFAGTTSSGAGIPVVPPPSVIASPSDLGMYGSTAGISVVKQEAGNSGMYGPATMQQDVGMYGPVPPKQELGLYGSPLPKPEVGMYGPAFPKKEPVEEYDPAAPTDDAEGVRGSTSYQARRDLSSRVHSNGPPVCPPADPEMLKVLEQLAVRVMLSGPEEEQNALLQHSGDPNYRFLQNKSSDEYRYFQWKVFSLSKRPFKGESTDADREDEGGEQDPRQPVKKKRRSRWGEQKATLAQPGVVAPTVGPPGIALPSLGKPGVIDSGLSVPGVVTNIQLGGPVTIQPQPGMSQPAQPSDSTNMASYARKVIGSDSISPEQLKQIKEQQEMNFMYELVMAQKKMKERALMSEIEGIKVKRKYEYDSDEETEGGTWEHRQRSREMDETKKWAEKLTSGARGKHFLGDFLPPEELEKFMETFKALKEGREPDYSDYKEFQLTCENMGYQMMVKMGWTEGAGLGSQGQGITKPVNKCLDRLLLNWDALKDFFKSELASEAKTSKFTSERLKRIVETLRGNTSVDGRGIGVERPEELTKEDDEYDAYRKRMMLAYRFRPNPLNNPRRPYY